MKASLNKLWSMLNSQQIAVYMPMYELKFPANAMMVTKEMVEIANFDLIPTDLLDEYLWY